MKINFGKIIKNSRVKVGLNQRELAELLKCSTVQISRMENDDTGISSGKLIELSYLLKFNFLKLYKHTSHFKSYLDYEAYFTLDKAMISTDVELIKSTLDYFNIVKNFNYGEPEIFKFYALAVVYSYSDVDKSMEYALKGLKIREFTFDNISVLLSDSLIEDSSLAILSVIFKNLFFMGKNDKAFELSKILFNHYNSVLFSKHNHFLRQTFFLKRQFIIVLNNYAHMNKLLENYKYSIEICDFAIRKCNEFNILNLLRFIYTLLMENYYLLDDINNAKKFYNFIYVYSTTTVSYDYYEKVTNNVKENYPKILE